jgi:aspartate/methionine/tyrosine aminotransferase
LDPNGKPLLLDPASDDPYEHIVFVPETGQFQGITRKGERTVEVFGLNRRQVLERGRRTTWTTLNALFRECAAAVRAKDDAWKKEVMQAVRDLSFQSVVQHYVRDGLDGRETVPPRVSRFLRRTRRDWEWAL